MVYQKANGNNLVENKVIDMLLDHVRIVQKGTEVLTALIDNWKSPGREKFNANVELLDSLEAQANEIKKDIMKEISLAGPVLLFRQDLMWIIRTTDQILDLAQGAAFFLNNLEADWIPPREIVENMIQLAEKTLYATKNLIDLIRALYQKLDKVIELSETIEMIENDADNNYRALIIDLARMTALHSTPIIIREAVDRIEEMVDKARDAALFIRQYAMSR
ncbi:MAG: hypothetical protein DRP02_09230 [Candidatus Gerdarchaeota archaeon]|nr:MAG: hypothetical protein DRO63_08405 [Candidatus Gerdarchaeota archaeon]RLI69985.1 MAG: hypothetical protein DRP02_09230 [Candidatus Gerdarchaeota archaeon]